MLKNIATHLTTHFVDNFDDCPIVYDGQPLTDMSDEDCWARFSIRFGDQRMITMGDNRITDQNIRVILQVLLRPGLGTARLYEIAETYSQLFRYYRHNEASFSIEGREPQITYLADHDYDQINISIPIRATFIAS